MEQTMKSFIYRLLNTSNGITKDYPVQATSVELAIKALAKKLDVNPSDITNSNKRYTMEELNKFWKNPKSLFVKAEETYESVSDLQTQKAKEHTQSDLNALLRDEMPKTVSDCDLYSAVMYDGNKPELHTRAFYSTIGIKKDDTPLKISNNKNYPRKGRNRPFVTDTNDVILNHPDTILCGRTDYIFPISVKGKTDDDSLNSVFRFPNAQAAYENVRQRIIDLKIANEPYRYNKNMTYLEACDSWLCGTSVKMGNKQASLRAIEKYNEDMSQQYPAF